MQSCENKKLLFLYIESNPDNINHLTTAEKVLEQLNQVTNKLKAKEIKLVILHSSQQETKEINVFRNKKSALYFYGTPKARPFPFNGKERLELALLLKEILQTIEEDPEDPSAPCP